jgi:peptidylprolyl isomerase
MIAPRILAAALAALALAAAGCGDSNDKSDSSSSAATDTTATATTETTATTTTTEAASPSSSSGAGAVLPISKDLKHKPKIPKPKGTPGAKLVVKDIVKGQGKAAKAGDTVTVQYVGVSYSTGQEFDASWDRGQPFSFPLGAQQVIPGWDQGVVGMKKGGRRELVIPPDLAYGPQGSPPAIGPNETLVFVIDLKKIA